MGMSVLLEQVIKRIEASSVVFAKSLAPNDTDSTGGHQCGIYVPKSSVPLIFDSAFEPGENHERFARIIWNEGRITESRFVYYGVGTRDEYRITRFGRGFDLLKPEHTGDVVVICKESEETYYAFVLSDDDDIQGLLEALSIPMTSLGGLIKGGVQENQDDLREKVYEDYYIDFGEDFPTTFIMAASSHEIDEFFNSGDIEVSADDLLLRWIATEYELFRYVEDRYYQFVTERPADTLEQFVKTGLEITNRRKARAGKSLEHHLSTIFDRYELEYAAQAVTELNKKPDFIFPSEDAYCDPMFPVEKLVFLGSKTTCKDRWRQVLNEADRIKVKYLFTLQQGVSPNQLDEMHEEGLTLVVPKPYHRYYPETPYESVISLEEFIARVRRTQL